MNKFPLALSWELVHYKYLFMKKSFLGLQVAVFIVLQIPALAQTIIPVQTKNTSLILQVAKDKHLNIEYIGSRLSQEQEYGTISSVRNLNEEGSTNNASAYPGAGTNIMFEPSIACVHADGNNSLDLQYLSHLSKKESDGSTLSSIVLKDPLFLD